MQYDILLVTQIFVLVLPAVCSECERSKCRTVRDVIQKELLPHYRSLGVPVPNKCPFLKERDRYLANEEHKERESSSKWVCGYCGKAFIGEVYLDNHFNKRHPETVYQGDNSVCLADQCEVFRCDVLTGVAKPTFWDVSLCMEEDMQDLTDDCLELMDLCIPETLQWNASRALKGLLAKSVCSFLTCKKYFEAPENIKSEDDGPLSISYVVLTIFLAIIFILYYCVAVNYFWFDTFSDLHDDERRPLVNPQGYESLFKDETVDLKVRVMTRNPKKSPVSSDVAEDEDIFNIHGGLESSLMFAEDS
ncbi:hypothetical protein DPMN_012452 [Dreissena polymorpha]|uniref:C2H2-type domain-containing protein n=2 Tax=Dreissena polymorpha TaxID=45954 RepID=A0A9D4N814_DREPO|nr:hypothetical protein DPMN_012452 [Dreissena polymorpha]